MLPKVSKTDYLKPRDFDKVYMLMKYENALAMRVSLETGLRIGDVLSLTPDNINEGQITAIAEKTNKPYKKKISSDLEQRLLQISGREWVFEGRDPRKHRTRATVWKDVKQASQKLGLEINLGCHSARKAYAVELFKSQGITAVQRELQHDNTETTMLYAFAHLLKSMPTDVQTVSEIRDSDSEEFLAELIADKVVEKLHAGLSQMSDNRTDVSLDNTTDTDL